MEPCPLCGAEHAPAAEGEPCPRAGAVTVTEVVVGDEAVPLEAPVTVPVVVPLGGSAGGAGGAR